MNSVETVGKTIDDAILAAVNQLGVKSKEDLDITVIAEGKKGFLGFGAQDAKILATKKVPNQAEIASNFLKEILVNMELVAEVEVEQKDNVLNINLVGDNLGCLIGKRGQTLDSLQYLTSLCVNKGDAPYVTINLDTENYRAKRKEGLEKLAHNLAKKVRTTKRSVVLEPMASYERRIIHSALQNEPDIKTYSEGSDMNRHIVIALKTTNN